MEKIYRAIKYMRTSCPDSELQYRDSIANQSRLIDGFLRMHPDIISISEKIDDGYSGLFFNRPAFKEMVEDIKTGTVNCVIVKDLSRMGSVHKEATTEHQNNVIDSQQTMYSPKK